MACLKTNLMVKEGRLNLLEYQQDLCSLVSKDAFTVSVTWASNASRTSMLSLLPRPPSCECHALSIKVFVCSESVHPSLLCCNNKAMLVVNFTTVFFLKMTIGYIFSTIGTTCQYNRDTILLTSGNVRISLVFSPVLLIVQFDGMSEVSSFNEVEGMAGGSDSNQSQNNEIKQSLIIGKLLGCCAQGGFSVAPTPLFPGLKAPSEMLYLSC